MQITVLNKRTLSDPLPGTTRVYVGRPSPLGNPFAIGRDGDRSQVISRYREWLWEQVQLPRSPARLELHSLLEEARKGPLELVCWCAPQACHADVLKRAIQWLDEQYEAKRE